MEITLKGTMKAKVKPTFIGFVNILLGRPVTIELDLKDVPVVFNNEV